MTNKSKVGVFTSSRADYGIYKPLLKALSADKRFDLELIAFGMHLMSSHGSTINLVQADNFGKVHQIEGTPQSDRPDSITVGYGKLIQSFAEFWPGHTYHWLIALGDRFEMSAAVQSTIPFQFKIAHLHGGETTLGAIDNIYRHQITLASTIHFTSTEQYKNRVMELTGAAQNVYNVGSLSLDNLDPDSLVDIDIFGQFNFPDQPFVLVTIHPETFHPENNLAFSRVVYESLKEIAKELNVVITKTNADTFGSCFIKVADELKNELPDRVFLVENFGRENYFAAVSKCQYLLGNTSSGIIEAASLRKFVINVGDRQKGRLAGNNVFDVPFETPKIVTLSKEISKMGDYTGDNIYFKSDCTKSIIDILANA